MCRHMEVWIAGSGGDPGQETKREVGDTLSDIAEGLDLSKRLLLLADGHWRECGHTGSLPIQGILKECAGRISEEVQRRRRELEGSGRVHFGSVLLEESADSDGPDSPPGVSPWAYVPLMAASPQVPREPALSGVSPVVHSMRREPLAPGALRRWISSFVARPALLRPR